MQSALFFYSSGDGVFYEIPASRQESHKRLHRALVGMLIHTLSSDRSAVGKHIKKFGRHLGVGSLSLRRSQNLFFLCGANASTHEPSARRKAVKAFIESKSPDFRVIYAENVFRELVRIGSKRNSLDIEHEISLIADKILIILESESAFCELGAFAHKNLRDKLIVINDAKFQTADSFINTGPLEAMKEIAAPVFWYPMAAHGVHSTDGIGATFYSLHVELTKLGSTRNRRINKDISDLADDKESLFFVHDLVLFTGPITHKELVNVLIHAFGKKNYDSLKNLLGVLKATSLICTKEVGSDIAYMASNVKPFFKYPIETSALTASFRRFHKKFNADRF